MQLTQPPDRLIRAQIGSKVLSKAPELFNQTLRTTLSELFQNARRAGAKNISITTEELEKLGALTQTRVTIEDDGAGIPDPQILLTFGSSGWDSELEQKENAAGMGFYSLASRGAVVESNDWKMCLNTKAFTGKEDVRVEANQYRTGTRISFIATDTKGIIHSAFADEAKYLPLTVTLNGQPVKQGYFLHETQAIKDTHGVRIGIVTRPQFPYTLSDVSFYGHVVKADLPKIYEASKRPNEPNIIGWSVKIDIVDCPDLRLVLPTRNSVIANEAYAEICKQAKIAVYEEIAKDAGHQLSFASFKEARELGVNMPVPNALILNTWIENSESGSFYGSGTSKDAVAVDASKPTPADLVFFPTAPDDCGASIAVAIGLEGAETNFRFLQQNHHFIGYEAIATIRTAVATFHAIVDGKPITFNADFEIDKVGNDILDACNKSYSIADELFVRLAIPNEPNIDLPIPALVYGDCGRGSSANAIILRTAAPDDIVDAVIDQSWSDDDDDTCDTIQDEKNEMIILVRECLMTTADARLEEILDTFRQSSAFRACNDKARSIDSLKLEHVGNQITLTVRFQDGQERTAIR